MENLSLDIGPKDKAGNVIFFLATEELESKDILTIKFTNILDENLECKTDESMFGLVRPEAFSKETLNNLKLETKGWRLQPIDDENDELFIVSESDFSLDPDKSITFKLTNFKGDLVEKPSYMLIESYGIFKYKDKEIEDCFDTYVIAKKNLDDKDKYLDLIARPVGGNIVYVTDPDKPDNNNDLSFYIKSSLRMPPEITAITGQSRFIVSFDYGDKLGDIADATKANKFKIQIVRHYNNKFEQNELKRGTDPYWEFRAASNVFLKDGVNDTIEFMFNDVVSTTGPGITRVHVEYFDIPGYHDGYCFFDVVKTYPEANILNFNADSTSIDCRKEEERGNKNVGIVKLSWAVFAVDFITLEYKYRGEIKRITSKDNPDFNIKEDEIPVDLYEDTRFTLTAYIEKIATDEKGNNIINNIKRSDQRQLVVSIEPTLKQYAMQCYYSGDDAKQAVIKCNRKFNLQKVSDSNLNKIVLNLKASGYKDDPIYNAVVTYYYQDGENEDWFNNETKYKNVIMNLLE